MIEQLLQEHVLYKSIGDRKKPVQITTHESFDENLEDYANNREVIDEVKNLFRNKKDKTLEDDYNDHELDPPLKEFWSVNLFYEPRGSKPSKEDVIIVHKRHPNRNQIVFHRIGNHERVYDPDYDKKYSFPKWKRR